MNVELPVTAEIAGETCQETIEDLLNSIDDHQVLGDFKFEGCKALARDLAALEVETLPTTRALMFDTKGEVLLLGNTKDSTRGATYEVPGGKVSNSLNDYKDFIKSSLAKKVESILATVLDEISEETQLFMTDGVFRYEGAVIGNLDGAYFLKGDNTNYTTPLNKRQVFWFSGALPPLYKERVRAGQTLNEKGKQEDEHDEFITVPGKEFQNHTDVLAQNSELPDKLKNRIVEVGYRAVADQVYSVIDNDYPQKTKLNFTDRSTLRQRHIRKLMQSSSYFYNEKERKLEVQKIKIVGARAMNCVRNFWGVDISEKVSQAFYGINSLADVVNFVGGRGFSSEQDLEAIRLILIALDTYGILAAKGFLRDDLEEVATEFRERYLKEFNFKPATKAHKEESNVLWKNYDKYTFRDQSGKTHNVFVRKNAKAEPRIVNKYITKPTLSEDSDIKDLLGLRFVFEDQKAVESFNSWLDKKNVKEKLEIKRDEEEGSNVEGSRRADQGEIKYIGQHVYLPCEVQIVPVELHKEDEKGIKHHSNYSGKQFLQGAARIGNTGLMSNDRVSQKVQKISGEIGIKPVDNWTNWRESFFKGPDDMWYSFETAFSIMNTDGLIKDQERVLKAFLALLNGQCGISQQEMTIADWYHLFNAPQSFVSNPQNLRRLKRIYPRLSKLKAQHLQKVVIPIIKSKVEPNID
ncbi:hypothetical protein GW756_02105 [bacterium]|nr:hypothetical protein [bacterium]NCQ55586.1 hypothetical protein [Candidatus Parcubacteria bacterium]NCS67411.1 hypothetical protein [Candidatus Peregrinibacteria bacterium]NCS96137.1 hypothetical protein [bacterium]